MNNIVERSKAWEIPKIDLLVSFEDKGVFVLMSRIASLSLCHLLIHILMKLTS